MRVLYDLYCDSAINEAYSVSTFPYITDLSVSKTTEAMASEAALQLPSGPVSASVEEMSTKQSYQSYQRFYKAVTRHWISVELFWLVRTQSFPNAGEFDKAFDRACRVWDQNPTRPLSDKLDIIEVVDFVWGFLGRKAFHPSSVPAWLQDLGEDVLQEYLDGNETEASNWGFFVRSTFQYLRPPNIIELLLWMWNSSRWIFNRPKFLQHLGLFDTWEGIQEDDSGMSHADNWIPITIVENDIESSVTHMQDVATFATQWKEYRYSRWPLDARGRIFFRDPTTEERFMQMIGSQIPS